ncbi:MAG: PASTA domain-containing protein [Chloroflexota bacterium]
MSELSERYKGSAGYILMTALFLVGIFILFLLFDNILIPWMVHDRDTVKVPNITGKSLDQAKYELGQADLVYHIAGFQYSEGVRANRIIRQVPSAYSVVKVGRPVLLIVSKGKQTVTVPYLLGKEMRNAQVELMRRGLDLGEVFYGYSEVFPRNTIMAQSIQNGQTAAYGDKIDITLSQGSETILITPQLIGMSLEAAKNQLTQLGLVLGTVNYKKSDTFLPDTVIDQYPAAGESTQRGSAVDLIIAN